MGVSVLVFEIKRAVLEDAKCLANIIVESWRSTYINLIPKDEIIKFLDKERRQQQFEKFIKNKEIILIVLYKGVPVGLVFANKDNDEQIEDCGSIYSIYILEEYWGKGLGTGLMDEAVKILKDEGCKRVSLWVYEENNRAIGFYEKCGFIFYGTKKYSHFSSKPVELRYIKEI